MKSAIEWKENIVAKFLKHNFLVIFLVSILCASAGTVVYLKVKTPSYSAEGQLVQNDNNYNLISSYTQFVSSVKFKNAMKKQIDKSSWKKYANRHEYSTEISSETNSPFFAVSVTSENGKYSIFLANTAMRVLIGNVGSYLSGANISTVSQARSAKTVFSKSEILTVWTVILVIVFVLSAILVFYKQVLMGTIKKEEYLENIAGIKNLGLIDIDNK